MNTSPHSSHRPGCWTLDDLNKRGYGEAIYANSTPAERAARLQQDDLTDMDRRIIRREEWMCAQTMINNACTMTQRSTIDDKTEGEDSVRQVLRRHQRPYLYCRQQVERRKRRLLRGRTQYGTPAFQPGPARC